MLLSLFIQKIKKINELKIDILEKDIENFESELKELQTLCDQLHELYQQRDNLLSMFLKLPFFPFNVFLICKS